MSVNFKATMDSSDIRKKLEEIRKDMSRTSGVAESEGRRMEEAFKRVGAAVGGVFAGQRLAGFARQVATVRGEFQQLEAAYRTMLGSREKAERLMRESIDFAATTPFDVRAVASGTKQLLAYGSQAAQVSGELRMLGDIAAGLSIPLNDIIYLYGTTRAQGRLFTMDLRQFMGRGIPLAEELARQFGVTTAEVGQLVTDGKVGFEEVRRALAAMTAEGGKFAGLMDAQSKTISGQISNLGDSVQQMLNNIGKASEGVISGAIGATAKVVENYREVGKALLEIIAAYGAYKAAVIAVSTVQKVRIRLLEEAAVQQSLAAASGMKLGRAEAMAAGSTQMLSRSLKGAALAAKAFVTSTGGIATIAVALGYAIYRLATYQTDYQKSLEEMNDSFDEGRREANAQISALAQLKGKLSQLKEGTEEYAETQKRIAETAGEYGIALKAEEVSVESLAAKYGELTAAITASYDARQYDSFTKTANGNWADTLSSELDDEIYDKLLKKYGDEAGTAIYQNIKNRIFEAVANGGKLGWEQVISNTNQWGSTTSVTDRGEGYIPEEIAGEGKMMAAWNRIAKAYRDYLKIMEEADRKFSGRKKPQTSGGDTGGDGEDAVKSILGVDYRAAEKEWKTAKARLAEMAADREKFTTEQYRAAVEQEKSAREAYEALGGNPTGDEKKVRERAKEEQKAREDARKEAEKKEAEYQEALVELARKSKEEQDNVLLEGMTDQLEIIDRKARMMKARIEAERADFKAEYGDNADTASFDIRINTVDNSAQQQKEQYLRELRTQYETIEQQRLNIVQRYQKDIDELRKAGYEKEAKEAEKAMASALDNLNIKAGGVYKQIFRDVAYQTKTQLVESIKLATEAVKELTDPEAISKVQQQIAAISEELANIEPIDFNADWRKVLNTLDQIAKKKKAIALIDDKSSKAAVELNNQIARLKENIKSQLIGAGIDAFVSGLERASSILKEMGGTINNDIAEGLSAASNVINGVMQGASVGGVYGAVIGGAITLMEEAYKAVVKIDKRNAELRKIQRDYYNQARLNQLKSTDFDTIFGTKALERAKDAAQKARSALLDYLELVVTPTNVSTQRIVGGISSRTEDTVRQIQEGISYTREELMKLSEAEKEALGLSDKQSPQRYDWHTDDYLEELKRQVKEQGDALRQFQVTTSEAGWLDRLFGGSDWTEDLQYYAPQLWDEEGMLIAENAQALLDAGVALGDREKEVLQQAIELKEAYDELIAVIEEVAESFFGEVSSDWAESIWDNYIKYGEAAISHIAEDMNDSLSAVAANFGKQMLAEMLNNLLTEKYAEKIKNVIIGESDESMPAMIGEMLQDMKMWTAKGIEFTDEYQKAMEQAGLSLEETTREASSKGIATASQESVDELNGRMTAVQGHTYSIAENTKLLVAGTADILDVVQVIETHTRRMESLESGMKSIGSKMDDIARQGLKIKG